MQKWEYAHAMYNGQGLDPHIQMDVAPGSLGDFLREAGQKGWELCGVLPYPTFTEKADGALAVLFKRPLK